MKKLLFTIALATILLTSCSKDDSLEQTELQTIESAYVLNQINDSFYWDTMLVEAPISSSDYSYERATQTEGHYQPISRNEMIITWSGTQNENAARGRAEITQSTPNFSFHIILETECVVVKGDEAVYGGVITHIRELSGDTPNIGVGWRFYFKVIDYGEGGNVAYDQIANATIFVSPSSPSLCNVYLPDHSFWYTSGYSEVKRPGFVIVDSNIND